MKYKLILFIFFQSWFVPLTGQSDADSLFRTAIRQSAGKDYRNALLTAKKVIDAGMERSDIQIFMANVYAWQENYDSSKYYLHRVFSIDPENRELYDSWLNVLLWNEEYDELLKTTDTAIQHNYDNEYNILVKKLIAFKSLGQYSGAKALFDESRYQSFLDSTQVSYLYREILLLSRTNFISLYYSLDYLSNSDNPAQHLVSVDYGQKFKSNNFIVRLNYANRNKTNNIQIESDLYLTVNKGRYFYLNYGYSFKDIIFPRHRAGAEFYIHLEKSFEASFGGRYLHFPEFPAGILTGSLSKYYGPYMFSFRPYYSVSNQGNSFALTADLRKYDRLPLPYWNLEIGYGNSPDERFTIEQAGDYLKLNSYRVRLGRNFVTSSTNELKLTGGYAYSESSLNYYFSRYTFELSFRFKL